MKVLLVEDDEYKASDISRALEEGVSCVALERAASVTSALRLITKQEFSLVILDMSLPTFDLAGPGGGGSPQGQGGLEVLRLAKRLNRTCSFVIVTQYPDIEIDGAELPLAKAAERLSSRFKVPILKCILYEFDRDEWKSNIISAVDKIDG